MEAKKILVEAIFGGGIFDEKASVNDAVGGRIRRGDGKAGDLGAFLNEVDEIAFRIVDGEESVRECVLDDNVVSFQVALESCGVSRGESYGSEAAGGCGGRQSFHFQPLESVDGVAGDAITFGVAEAEGFAVEIRGGRGVGGIHADEGDTGDRGALLRLRQD
jgi:hypothetical protein